MLSLEMAIQKIQQFPTEQRNQVIQFVEFLDFTSSQATTPQADPTQPDPDAAFFELTGMWETKTSPPNPAAITSSIGSNPRPIGIKA